MRRHFIEKESNQIPKGQTEVYFSEPVTDGKTARVILFGAAVPGIGIVKLEWGDGDNWELIRAVAGATYEFKCINQDYIGNGQSRFRISQTNQGGSGPLKIVTWFRAIEIDG